MFFAENLHGRVDFREFRQYFIIYALPDGSSAVFFQDHRDQAVRRRRAQGKSF